MHIVSIEPTPSPNTMKVNLDMTLPAGVRFQYSQELSTSAPEPLHRLLAISGVHSILHTANFLAISRNSQANWQDILSKVRIILGDSSLELRSISEPATLDSSYGQAQVKLQVFRSIPLHVRVRNGHEEVRLSMPEPFTLAALRLGMASPTFIQERKLIDLGTRYGELLDIAHEIIAEQQSVWTEEKLININESFTEHDAYLPQIRSGLNISDQMQHPDWRERFLAIQHLTPSLEMLPYLLMAIQDQHVSIRRLAIVYISEIKLPEVLPYLIQGLQDSSAIVRRTAGDCLSDFGDPRAIPAMCNALQDTSKLVRWRAARFLYEVGDGSCLSALEQASGDSEFEVRMQAQLAYERIQAGKSAEGSVWQQMTRMNER